MARYWDQVSDFHYATSSAAILVVGDLFDSWKAPIELVNAALSFIPDDVWALPGQHDLPYHSYTDINKSPFWTLVKTGKIRWLEKPSVFKGEICVHPFGWNKLVEFPNNPPQAQKHIALVHSYIWLEGHVHPGAEDDDHVAYWSSDLKRMGFDAAFYGDNHRGFNFQHRDGIPIMNCGTFIRRKADEIDYKPRIGIYGSDGKIYIHYLDTSEDRFTTAVQTSPTSKNYQEVIDSLKNIGNTQIDFVEQLERALKDPSTPTDVRTYLIGVLEHGNQR